MILRRLELVDVRSYEQQELTFEPGVTLLVGPNAHGKTNLLEAAHRVATGSSHRVASDLPLVRRDAEAGYVRVELDTDAGRRRKIELELRPGAGTRARVDGQAVRQTSDAVGVLRVVLFAPEDLAIVAGDPSERRRFLDDVLAQRRPAYAAARSDYDRVLRQRNRLLKTAGGRGGDVAATLQVWTAQLVAHAATLTAARVAAVHALAGPTSAFYAELADLPEPVTLTYRSSCGLVVSGDPGCGVPDRDALAVQLRAGLEAVADEELARGVTLVGPHRDDLELSVRGLPARGYASHGQHWTLALALRLATYDVLAEVGDHPVVLLDDVFAELDQARRARLAAACQRWGQVLVTAAVEDDVPLRGAVVDVRVVDGRSTVATR
ncbi:MAG: DNA replication/repair protein RecF [Actinobacteria bacterium]|nr:DNA replication/repair protein RecF [Actinomycetota bacterium]